MNHPFSPDPDHPSFPLLGRRDWMKQMGALGAAALAGGSIARAGQIAPPGSTIYSARRQLLTGTCPLTPTGVQGPFYLNLNHVRQDITEGQPGLPMALIFQVRDAATCQPIAGAEVDVWHTSWSGQYSGFAQKGTVGETWLRGIQISDQDGLVVFFSIFPGWYPGRTPHVHVKVRPNMFTELTAQTYFPTPLFQFIFQNLPPYDQDGISPTDNSNDFLYQAQNEMAWLVAPTGPLGVWAGTILTVNN